MRIALFLMRRLATILPLLLVVLLATFMLIRLGNSDPVQMLVGPTATPAETAIVRAQLGLDRPLWVQFGLFLVRLAHGDLGTSWLTGTSVLRDIAARLPATLELIVLGVGIGCAVGVPAGLYAAAKPEGAFDHISRVLSLIGFSVPTHWLGLILMFVFFYLLNWAPPGLGRISLFLTPPPVITGSTVLDALLAGDWAASRSAAAQLVLPVLAIAIIAAAPILKQARSAARDVMVSDPLRYAMASGLSSRTQRRIVLRNTATPILTFIATEFVSIIGTTSLIEYVFAWGGIGQYGLNAIASGDFAAVQGYVLALAAFAAVVLMVSDLFILWLEPRAV